MSESDLHAFANLMESGFSLSQAMDILEDSSHRLLFKSLRVQLGEGKSVDTFFPDVCPGTYGMYLRDFVRYMPFLESLLLSIDLADKEKARKKELEKGLLYPCGLLGGISAGIFVFDRTVLPNMMSLLMGFGADDGKLEILQIGIEFVSVFLIFASLVLCAFLFVCTRKRYIVRSYCFAASFFRDSFPVRIASVSFAQFYLQCTKRGISTRRSIRIMEEMKDRPLIAFIAQELDAAFLKGESMQDAVRSVYIERKLAEFFRIAVHTEDTPGMIEGYLAMAEERTRQEIRRFTAFVQVLSYCAVGAVVILVYRVLMMPMKMLQKI